MKKLKILNTIEPKKDRYGRCRTLAVVTIDFGNGVPIKSYMNEYSYEIFKLEQKLLNEGVDGELLDKYKEAVQLEKDYYNFWEDCGEDI
jgi:hypothetical protein